MVMHKETITYTDFDGNKRTEEHYFNLTKAEFFNWITTTGDYTIDKLILKLVSEHNGKQTMAIFEDLMRRSYGVKSLDGRKFQKSNEIWEDFHSTEAYSQMFMEIVLNADKAVKFFNGIIPPEMLESLEKDLVNIPDEVKEGLPPDALKALEMIKAESKPQALPRPTTTPQVNSPLIMPG